MKNLKMMNNKTVDFGNILICKFNSSRKIFELYHFNSEKDKINDHFEANGQSIKNINENSN